MSAKLEKQCPNCNQTFFTYRSINAKHCSDSCSRATIRKSTYEKYKQVCEVCEAEFLPKRPADGGRFCSYACSGIANRKERVDRNGYWYVCDPEHPNANKQGYVPEHHIVVERNIGRCLQEGEVVHHINGIKKDNALENLQLMTDSEHKSLHARAAGRACMEDERGRFV